MRITQSRGLTVAALILAALISGCAASQQAAVRDDIRIVETAPDTVAMTMEHKFYSGGSFADEWPEEKARFAQRTFLLAAAEEAQKRGKPGFMVEDLDGGWNSRGMTDGFRMYDVNTTVRMEATVTFLDLAPQGKQDGVYATAEALSLFGA